MAIAQDGELIVGSPVREAEPFIVVVLVRIATGLVPVVEIIAPGVQGGVNGGVGIAVTAAVFGAGLAGLKETEAGGDQGVGEGEGEGNGWEEEGKDA